MIENITVIGAGTMGLGIGHVAALAGYNVTLNDISMDILNQAMDVIKKNMEKGIERGKLDKAAMGAAMERIDLEADMEKASKEADLIIEAIIEKLDVKCELFHYRACCRNPTDGAICGNPLFQPGSYHAAG